MGEPRVPPRRMIGSANGTRIGITGLGVHVPERVVTNDDLAQYVDTTDEWIVDRTGIHERRMITEDQALTDIALPAARAALDDAGATAGRHRPSDLRHRDAGHDVPDSLGADGQHAGRREGGGLRPPRRLYGVHVRDRPGVRDDRGRPLASCPRGRWRRPLVDPRLDGPLDARALRRRRGRRRDGAGRPRRLPRIRARRRRGWGRPPPVPREAARGSSRTPSRC